MSIIKLLSTHLDPANPLVYIDVGAMGGLSSYWKAVSDYCRIVAFEPDQREFVKLKSNDRLTYLPYVLHHSSQDVRFFIAKDQGKSSLYPPNMSVLEAFPDASRYQTVEEVMVSKDRVKTLDDALSSAALRSADFIKLDTQGSELDILNGARASLREICGVEVEAEFLPLYQSQPLFGDVHAFLTAQGFELMDLRRAFWKRTEFTGYIGRGQLVFGDALYLRNIEALISAWDLEQRTDISQKIVKIIIVAMVYRLPDYASALIERARIKGMVTDALASTLKVLIQKEAATWGLPRLPARKGLAKIFNRIAESVRPASHLGWADGDRFIGNTRNI